MPLKDNPFSLSTSWNWREHKNARSLVDEIKGLGFDAIELNFTLEEPFVRDVISLKDSGYIKISSTHNFCPIPAGTLVKNASPDYYSLASLDEEERHKALRFTKRTIDYARMLGASAVMLHTGRIKMKDATRKMAELLGDKNKFGELKEAVSGEREEKKAPHLERVIKSLEELVPYAKKNEIRLAVENRFYHTEIPGFEELAAIFGSFPAQDLYYWHDVGHAQVYEIFGFRRHEDYLEAYGDRLLGVHIHDIMYPIQDHMAPGTGSFDFRRIRPFLKEDTIRVLEVHRPATAAEIKKSVRFLREVLYD